MKTPDSKLTRDLQKLRGLLSALIAAQRAAERAAAASLAGTMRTKLRARDKAWRRAAARAKVVLIDGFVPAAPGDPGGEPSDEA